MAFSDDGIDFLILNLHFNYFAPEMNLSSNVLFQFGKKIIDNWRNGRVGEHSGLGFFSVI